MSNVPEQSKHTPTPVKQQSIHLQTAIANEAFDVYAETGKTPRALQSQNAELVKVLQFARGEAITARGVLWTKADAAEAWPDGKRHSEGLRRSAEKLDDVVSECDAALAKAHP